MRVRVIDYVGNVGGGIRFASELVGALGGAGVHAEVVSHGAALARYRAALADRAGVSFLDIPFHGVEWRWRRKQTWPLWGSAMRAVGRYGKFHFRVPARALEGCDVAWFPWVHRHRLPRRGAERVVGSLHDLIILQFPQWFSKIMREDERETVRRWCRSGARVIVSSEATAAALGELFGAPRSRLDLVPLAGQHRVASAARTPGTVPTATEGPFLLCPANTCQHKNHDVLLDGHARWGARWPLVLTGPDTDLSADAPRARDLRGRLARNGLALGRDVHGLGLLDESTYFAVLRRARAVVMPTLAEGGGSFPVWEALFAGVPAVCSDIPVLREMMARVGGEVLWFDPRDPDALAARLAELEERYTEIAARARAQVPLLRDRSWADVAVAYRRIFSAVAGERESEPAPTPAAAGAR